MKIEFDKDNESVGEVSSDEALNMFSTSKSFLASRKYHNSLAQKSSNLEIRH
jgi:hypothetical protein